MNRSLAKSLGMTLGLLAANGYAQEANWRAARSGTTPPPPVTPIAAIAERPTPPAAAPAPVPPPSRWLGDRPRATVQPASAVVQVAALRPLTVRGQSDDGSPVPPPGTGFLGLPAPPPVFGIPVKAPQQPPAPERINKAPTPEPATRVIPVVPSPVTPAPAPPVLSSGPVDVVPMDGQYLDAAPMVAAPGRAPRWLVSAEYLAWWVSGASIPPLVTTSPPAGANGVNGALPGSTILLAGDDLDTTFRQGARFGTVYWFDDCASCGFDGRIFFTGRIVNRFAADSTQFPNLFRPFTAANPGLGAFSEQVTRAGQTIGGVRAENRSIFWGAEANYRDNLCCGCNWRTDLLAGFRYLNLDERLTFTEDFTRLQPQAVQDFPGGPRVIEPAGTRIVIQDQFETRNDFYGGQLGLATQYRRDRWVLDFRTAVALGVTHQELRITGVQNRFIPGMPQEVFQGGLLALNSNIGTRSRDVFSVVPEVGLNVGYQMTDHLKLFVGYNFLYWSNVIRPGDQIDTVIDVNRVPRFVPPGVVVPAAPPPARPAVLFRDTDFWAQGINVGMEYRW